MSPHVTVLEDPRCPICRQPASLLGNVHRPFCSERCRLQDLGNWASERYRIPGPSEVPAAEAGETDGDHDE